MSKDVEQNFSKAAEYYEKAAELGHKSAMFKLGVMDISGRGVKQDDKKAAALDKMTESD
ncbi:MAG: sel1 repeat family protein [Selenomonadaceae bacterium]|nr:sel1 repeat family protein [Selenomonadaceae bacterium]